MSAFLTVVGLIIGLIALDIAAMLWGTDSREGPDHPEWERRRIWKGYRW